MLGADKLDGSHGSLTPAANAVPVADSNGKVAAGWIPLPSASSIGGIFMDADCLAGNHVSGIDLQTGQLKCTVDTSTGGGLGGTVTTGKILLAATASTAGDSAMTENSGDITSIKPLKATSFQGTATADQSLDLPPVSSEAVSAAGHSKLISKSNQLQLSVNGGPFATVGTNLPPGSNFQLPYNNNGAWGVLAGYTINPNTGEMAVPGPVSSAGTSQIANITESTPTNAVAGKGKVQYNLSTHRPVYCFDGTTLPCSDNVLQADTSVTSAANKVLKQDGNGKIDDTVLPTPATTTLGGVMSKAAETNKFLTAINTDGSVANGTLPIPTRSAAGVVTMAAACSAGQHVSDINQSTGALTCSADSGSGGGGKIIIRGQCAATQTAAATNSLFGLGGNSTGCGATWSAGAGWPSTGSYTIQKLHAVMGTSKNGNSYPFTIWKQACSSIVNGACTNYAAEVATTLTCTATGVSAGNIATCSDTTHGFTVGEFDLVTLKWTTVASDSVANVTVAVEAQ